MARMQDQYMYFLYSAQQHKERESIESTLGKKYKPGSVVDSGVWKQFTEKTLTTYNRYADAKIVHEGYLKDCEYVESTSTWGV